MDIERGRQIIAELAKQEGENKFAREVLARCWDHRFDVQVAAKDPEGFKARKLHTN